MPNIGKVLREEIERLARKQVRGESNSLRRETVRLKKGLAQLRRQVAALDRTSRELLKKVAPVVAVKESEAAAQNAAKLRPTAESLKSLRARLGLTQAEFGKLLGVSSQAVVQWGNKEGRVRLRSGTLSALATIRHIGKREARRRLDATVEPHVVRQKPRK